MRLTVVMIGARRHATDEFSQPRNDTSSQIASFKREPDALKDLVAQVLDHRQFRGRCERPRNCPRKLPLGECRYRKGKGSGFAENLATNLSPDFPQDSACGLHHDMSPCSAEMPELVWIGSL